MERERINRIFEYRRNNVFENRKNKLVIIVTKNNLYIPKLFGIQELNVKEKKEETVEVKKKIEK